MKDPLHYLIISGDLSKTAAVEQYDELYDMLAADMPSRLGQDWRRRILVVPGNHDVSWGHCQYEPAQPTDDEFRRYFEEPEVSRFRIRFSEPSEGRSPAWVRSIGNREDRFRSFDAFCKRLYEGVSDDATFRLPRHVAHATESRRKWMALRTECGNAVICGFSSCTGNDQWWRGAHIDHKAIKEAARFADETQCPRRIAVWHHGLISKSTDRVHLADIAFLAANKFQVGLHGHVHHPVEHDLFQRSMYFYSPGTIDQAAHGVPPGHTPGFGVLEIGGPRLIYQPYVLRPGLDGSIRYEPTRRSLGNFSEMGRIDLSSETTSVRSRRVTRQWSINEFGIARVAVTFSGITGNHGDHLTLAAFDSDRYSWAFAGSDSEPKAKTHSSIIPIQSLPREGGRGPRIEVVLDEDMHGDMTKDRLEATYHIANIVAFSPSDIACWQRPEWLPLADGKRDFLSHTVTHEYEELLLKFEAAKPVFGLPEVVAERPSTVTPKWRIDRAESARCRPGLVVDPNAMSVSLRIATPLPGYRYSMSYTPLGIDEPQERRATAARDALIRSRSRVSWESDTSRLREAVEKALLRQAGVPRSRGEDPFSPSFWWLCNIWDKDSMALAPVTGRAPLDRFGETWRRGQGVAGHCYRFCALGTYDPRGNAETNVVFDSQRRGHLTPPGWVVCVPLYRDRFAIGVVGLAGIAQGGSPSVVADYYRNLARSHSENQDTAKEGLGKLTKAVNDAFWSAVPTIARERAPATKQVRRRGQ